MRNLFLIFCLSTLFVACGKSSNKVNSGSEATGTNAITPKVETLANFAGNYYLIDMRTNDCGAAIVITRVCNGYRVESNNRFGAEDFCNVNLNGDTDRNPPNPDRNPPNPDRNPPNPDTNPPVVTQKGNVLTSTIRLSPSVVFTSSLTLNDNGVLVKISDLKSRKSRCMYQKR